MWALGQETTIRGLSWPLDYFPIHNRGLGVNPNNVFKDLVRSASLCAATSCLVMPDNNPVGCGVYY